MLPGSGRFIGVCTAPPHTLIHDEPGAASAARTGATTHRATAAPGTDRWASFSDAFATAFSTRPTVTARTLRGAPVRGPTRLLPQERGLALKEVRDLTRRRVTRLRSRIRATDGGPLVR
jgi:hypothetical protein